MFKFSPSQFMHTNKDLVQLQPYPYQRDPPPLHESTSQFSRPNTRGNFRYGCGRTSRGIQRSRTDSAINETIRRSLRGRERTGLHRRRIQVANQP
jgi:hypothetical protein